MRQIYFLILSASLCLCVNAQESASYIPTVIYSSIPPGYGSLENPSSFFPVTAGDSYRIRANLSFQRKRPLTSGIIKLLGTGLATYELSENAHPHGKNPGTHQRSYLLPAIGVGLVLGSDKLSTLTGSRQVYLRYFIYNKDRVLQSTKIIRIDKSMLTLPYLATGIVSQDGFIRVELDPGSQATGSAILELSSGDEPEMAAAHVSLPSALLAPLHPSLRLTLPVRLNVMTPVSVDPGFLNSKRPPAISKAAPQQTRKIETSPREIFRAPVTSKLAPIAGKEIGKAPFRSPARKQIPIFHKGLLYVRLEKPPVVEEGEGGEGEAGQVEDPFDDLTDDGTGDSIDAGVDAGVDVGVDVGADGETLEGIDDGCGDVGEGGDVGVDVGADTSGTSDDSGYYMGTDSDSGPIIYVSDDGTVYQLDPGSTYTLDNGEVVTVNDDGTIQSVTLASVTVTATVNKSTGDVVLEAIDLTGESQVFTFNAIQLASESSSILERIGGGFSIASIIAGGLPAAINIIKSLYNGGTISLSDVLSLLLAVAAALGIAFGWGFLYEVLVSLVGSIWSVLELLGF